MRSSWLVRVVMVVLPLLTAFTTQGTQSVAAASVLPPGDNHYYGHTYSEWSAEWWKWVLGANDAPYATEGPCWEEGQPEQVWFLAGTNPVPGSGDAHQVKRTCTIPADRAILIPIVTAAYYPENNANNNNVTAGRQWTGNLMDKWLRKASLTVTVDEVTLEHEQLLLYRVASPVFEASVQGILHDRIVADGVYVLLEPLAPGQHTVGFTVVGWYAMDVKYDLIVVGP